LRTNALKHPKIFLGVAIERSDKSTH